MREVSDTEITSKFSTVEATVGKTGQVDNVLAKRVNNNSPQAMIRWMLCPS